MKPMNNTKANWILLVLFCVLTVLFSIALIMTPANGDQMNTLARVAYWLGIVSYVMMVVVEALEIRRKNRDNKQ